MYARVRNGGCVLARAARSALPVPAENGAAWSLALLANCDGALRPCAASLHGPAPGVWTGSLGGPLAQQLAFMAGGAKHKGKPSVKDSKGGKGGKGAGAEGEEEVVVEPLDLEPFKTRMTRALEQLHRDLSGVRTSAHPGLLDGVHVEAPRFGTRVPLRSVATVVLRNPTLLVVEVYDKGDIPHVVAAIQQSTLSLQARVEGGEVLVPVPRMTMEVVEKMSRLAKDEGEGAKVEVRRVRHDALEVSKKRVKHLSKDEAKREAKQIQDLTDGFTAQVDELVKSKVEDLRRNH